MNHVHHRANLQECEMRRRLPKREARLAPTPQTLADGVSFRNAHQAIQYIEAIAKRMAMIFTLGNKDDPRTALPRISGINQGAIKRMPTPAPANCHPTNFLNSRTLLRRRYGRCLHPRPPPELRLLAATSRDRALFPASTRPKPRYYLRAELLQMNFLFRITFVLG
jgi:hypothetical protein